MMTVGPTERLALVAIISRLRGLRVQLSNVGVIPWVQQLKR
jgi:hypothetical protein